MNKFVSKIYCILALSLVVSNNTWAQVFHGEVQIAVSGGIGHEPIKSYLLIENDKSYELILPTNFQESKLSPGDKVTVDGEENVQTNQIRVKSLIIEAKGKQTLKKNNLTTEHDLLVLLVNYNDKQTTDTTSIDAVEKQLFLNRDSVNVALMKSTFGQIRLKSDNNGDGKADIYTVHVGKSLVNMCFTSTIATQARLAAMAAGIDVNKYKTILHIVPANIECQPWWNFTVSHFGCINHPTYSCDIVMRAAPKLSFNIAQTFGLCLGIAWSALDLNNDGSTESYLGDNTCFMGTKFYRQLNAVQRDRLNLFQKFPKRLKTVTESTQVNLFSLDKSNDRLQVLKIPRADNTQIYYVSYRTNHGPLGMGEEYANKVHIHRSPPDVKPLTRTYFIKTLDLGETFVDEPSGITVNVLAIEDNKAVVSITIPK